MKGTAVMGLYKQRARQHGPRRDLITFCLFSQPPFSCVLKEIQERRRGCCLQKAVSRPQAHKLTFFSVVRDIFLQSELNFNHSPNKLRNSYPFQQGGNHGGSVVCKLIVWACRNATWYCARCRWRRRVEEGWQRAFNPSFEAEVSRHKRRAPRVKLGLESFCIEHWNPCQFKYQLLVDNYILVLLYVFLKYYI